MIDFNVSFFGYNLEWLWELLIPANVALAGVVAVVIATVIVLMIKMWKGE